jgi:metallo-beta-lactamase family protein
MLLDSAELMEEEAERANRYGYSRHKPALPLYTGADAEATFKLLRTHRYGAVFSVAEGVRAVFRHAGHILGSATVELRTGRPPKRVVFSGDLGRWGRPIIHDPDRVGEADILLLESTYGNRTHAEDVAGELAAAVSDAARRGRAILIPAFALGRTQEILWWIRQLEDEGRIPALPVYLDSPLALDVTAIYAKHPDEHDLDSREMIAGGRSPLRPRRLHLARSPADSRALNGIEGPVIIIAGSGMATGGRILHHLKLRLPESRTMVLLPGFQAQGTRGRLLQDGARQIKIHGTSITVRADVRTVDGLSAHADRRDLLRWVGDFKTAPPRIYLVHGEPEPAKALAAAIRRRFRVDVRVARDGEEVRVGDRHEPQRTRPEGGQRRTRHKGQERTRPTGRTDA